MEHGNMAGSGAPCQCVGACHPGTLDQACWSVYYVQVGHVSRWWGRPGTPQVEGPRQARHCSAGAGDRLGWVLLCCGTQWGGPGTVTANMEGQAPYTACQGSQPVL